MVNPSFSKALNIWRSVFARDIESRKRKMGLHVTLVNPPYRTRPHQHPPFPPLGIGYLAAVLEKNNFKVEVIDCQASRYTYDDYKREIAKRKPDIIGVTAPTRLYNSAKEVLKISKEAHPNAVTLLGGSHVTFWNEKAFKNSTT
jgi:hypothetical protein